MKKGGKPMMYSAKFLAVGLVLGGGIGILVGSLLGNIPMGIVFGGGFGLVIGLAVYGALSLRSSSR